MVTIEGQRKVLRGFSDRGGGQSMGWCQLLDLGRLVNSMEIAVLLVGMGGCW